MDESELQDMIDRADTDGFIIIIILKVMDR
jgi:hypothetical protein